MIKEYKKAKDAGISAEQYIAQQGLFGEIPSHVVELIKIFE